jgi:catechol 2,3-dioxygenase-like lactoylglutathione lyase family enzyme
MKNMSLFHALHHVCIVVRDMKSAVAYYESLGIGPWHEYPSLQAYKDELAVPDREAYFKLRYMYANLENAQIQLCAPPEGNTPQRRFLETRGEGVFHLGFSVTNLDAAEAEGVALGLRPMLRGRLPDRSGFTYFDTAEQGAGVILEIRQSKLT